MTSTVHDGEIEGVLAKKVVGWIVAVGLAAFFAAGALVADIRGRVHNLEKGQFTREEAGDLRSSLDLLRQEITYLRADLKRVEDRR